MTTLPSARPVRQTGGLLLRPLLALACAAALGLLPGCVLGGRDQGTVQVLNETPSPSLIVVATGEVPPAAAVISVIQPVPAPKVETAPKRPGPNFVWMEGNWRYYSGQYVWIPGRWAVPPRPNALYTPPQWELRNGNKMFTEGYWHF